MIDSDVPTVMQLKYIFHNLLCAVFKVLSVSVTRQGLQNLVFNMFEKMLLSFDSFNFMVFSHYCSKRV